MTSFEPGRIIWRLGLIAVLHTNKSATMNTVAKPMSAYGLKGNGSACRFIDGEAVLINAETSAYYSMNRTGTFIIEVMAKDKVSNKTIQLRYPLTVLDIAGVGAAK